MSCTCGGGNTRTQVRDAVERTAGFVGLSDAFTRIEDMQSSTYSATRWMRKAGRAQQAGFNEQIAATYRQQARMARNHAVRQGRAAIAALDERTGRADWPALVETLSKEFISHDGQDAFNDVRERTRFELVELDRIPSKDVGSIVEEVTRASIGRREVD
jgi:hypothetical protein